MNALLANERDHTHHHHRQPGQRQTTQHKQTITQQTNNNPIHNNFNKQQIQNAVRNKIHKVPTSCFRNVFAFPRALQLFMPFS
jgi:hypothetical protein